jgi:hypothetical protein
MTKQSSTHCGEQSLFNLGLLDIHVWPTNDPNARRRLSAGEAVCETFSVSLTAISGFLACEISDGVHLESFCIPVHLDNLPSHRQTQLIKELLGSTERFMNYLVSLLDESAGSSNLEPLFQNNSLAMDSKHELLVPAVLEKMLKTMRSEPRKLQDISPLIDDLGRDDLLPEGFLNLWASIIEVANRGSEK